MDDPSTYPPDYPWFEYLDEETENPWDILGLSPLAFLEIVSSTSARFTQVGFEVWNNFNPVGRYTQVGIEVWERFNPEARFSQVGLEVWRTTGDKLRRLVNVYYL